jgi:hypothetical protein
MKKNYRKLNDCEKRCICTQIAYFRALALDSTNPLRDVARKLISLMLWRWTADAVKITEDRTNTGIIRQDAWKYNTDEIPATKEAKKIRANGYKGLIHEHVVPQRLIINKILSQEMNESTLFDFLTKFCKAAIISKDEDRILEKKLRNTMPENWDWNETTIYARYTATGLQLELPPD